MLSEERTTAMEVIKNTKYIFAVKDYILGKSALDAGKIYATGCGEYNPVADNSTPEGRARNRRVEIKIYNSYNSN